MSDRFDEIDYKMDSLSTYLIMRHSFTIPDEETNEQVKTLKANILPQIEEVLDFITHGNADQQTTSRDCFLCTPTQHSSAPKFQTL